MTSFLLELKEQFFLLVGKREKLLLSIVKFVIALVLFLLINGNIGYMEQADNIWIVLLLALLCAFTPPSITVVCGAGLILAHFYALATELCIITLLVFLLMFFLYFRFTRNAGYPVALTGILSAFGIPYVMPVCVGLLGKPYNVISVACASVVFSLVENVKQNEALFRSFTDKTTTATKYSLAANQIFGDYEMYFFILAFIAAAIVVYFVRKRNVDHAWTIAVVVGTVVQLVFLCGCELVIGNGSKIIWIFIGCIVSLLLGLIVQFMMLALDYSRVERVQFEDDEYYYYVKAVPKATMAVKDKQVKQISGKKKKARVNRGKKAQSAVILPKEDGKDDELAKKAMEEFDVDGDWLE